MNVPVRLRQVVLITRDLPGTTARLESELGELEDAEVLLTMVAVAARVGQATIEPQTIDE